MKMAKLTALATLSLAAGCASGGTAAPPLAVAAPHTISGAEGRVTYSVTYRPGQCHTRDSGRLPDSSCTPGSIDPAVTQATIHRTICVKGWTATVRPPSSQTDLAKFEVSYRVYGLAQGTVSELDHLIPLELGGSNDITNLWPEIGRIPNPKDAVENELRAAVCAGTLTLRAARLAIARNWETAPVIPSPTVVDIMNERKFA